MKNGIARRGGVELAFDVDGSGPDLLLVVGTASTRALWALVRSELSKHFRTIAFDNRDSGESTIVDDAYTLHDLALDVAAVAQAAGAQRPHVLGHSMGGAIAQAFALEFPSALASLTLVCSWARNDAYSRNVFDLMLELTRTISVDRALLSAILFAGAGVTTVRTTSLDEMTDAAMALGPLAPRAALERQWRVDKSVDVLDRIGSLQLPVHVISGTEDRLLPPWHSEQLAHAVPHAHLSRIHDAGHVPMVHAPEAFVACFEAFIERLDTRTTA